jgi:hypothetical protein
MDWVVEREHGYAAIPGIAHDGMYTAAYLQFYVEQLRPTIAALLARLSMSSSCDPPLLRCWHTVPPLCLSSGPQLSLMMLATLLLDPCPPPPLGPQNPEP